MPEIKLKHMVSVTSEDKVFKGENLLKPEHYQKWKCATPGQARASIIIQFEKASEIHSIDIGNEGSAFVEVFVGKSSDSITNYQVILPASSFMSPLESKNATKPNRVRMFGPEKLTQNLKNEKWDCVQIVCTQPFNKFIQYGLSFIKLHSPPIPIQESVSVTESKESTLKLGAFKIKDEDEKKDLSVGSWFQKRSNSFTSPITSSPPASKQEFRHTATTSDSKEVVPSKVSSPVSVQAPGIKRKYIPVAADMPSKNSKLDLPSTTKKEVIPSTKQIRDDSPKAGESTQKPTRKKIFRTKPFSRMMEKVVFVLSGFQNPYRSELRDKALEMGAKYKGDWEDSCTHLVCAFVNTPKYVQVRGKGGRVVSKDWISDCYKKKKLLPWREYRLGKYSKDTTTEEESEEENVQVNVNKLPAAAGNKNISNGKDNGEVIKPDGETKSETTKTNGTTTKSAPESKISDDSEEEDYLAATDPDDNSSGGDTEDEIRKVVEHQAKQREKNSKTLKGNISDDENCDNPDNDFTRIDTKDLPLPKLPEVFKGKVFFMYGNFPAHEEHKLHRYIIAFNGLIEEYMGSKVKFVVTNSKWDKNFDEALQENDNLVFVRPQWIFKCGQKCTFVPYQPYIVVPEI